MTTEPDSELRLVRVVGPGFVAGFETDGKRVWREAPILHELHSLTNDEARKIIAAKGWRATVVKGRLPLRLDSAYREF